MESSSPLVEYTSTETAIDANNNSYVDFFATSVTAKVTMTFYFDSDNNPVSASAPNLQAGATVSGLRLFVESRQVASVKTTTVGTDRNYYFPMLIVEGNPITVRVKEKLMITATFQTTGAWYYPGTTGSS